MPKGFHFSFLTMLLLLPVGKGFASAAILNFSHPLADTTLLWADRHIHLEKEGNQLFPYTLEQARTGHLTFLDLDTLSKNAKAYILRTWRKSGKPPVFIKGKEAQSLVSWVNSQERAQVNLQSEDGVLPEHILWEGTPDLITGARWTYPWGNKRTLKVSPQSPSWSFSPENLLLLKSRPGLKVISAFRKSLEEDLIVKWSINNRFSALGATTNHHQWRPQHIEESKEGWHFNGKNASVLVNDPPIDDAKAPFSVLITFRPEEIKADRMSLLNQGRVFDIKLIDNHLVFNHHYDYKFEKVALVPYQWYELVVVFFPGKKFEYYLNGELLFERDLVAHQYVGQAWVVGSNIWGEYFKGTIQHFLVWDRPLSKEEVSRLYEFTNSPLFRPYIYWGLMVLGFFLILVFYLYKKPKKMPVFKQHSPGPVSKWQLIGGFQILDAAGTLQSHHFSALQREFLISLFLCQLQNKPLTTKRMNQIFWPDKSTDQAKNSRSSLLSRLRKEIKAIGMGSIEQRDGHWFFDVSEKFQVDAQELENLLNTGNWERKDARVLLQSLANGNLVEEDATDFIHQEVLHIERKWWAKLQAQLEHIPSPLRSLAFDALLRLDPLNEEVFEKKTAFLLMEGEFHLAEKGYQSFVTNYFQQLEMEFPIKFSDYLNRFAKR
ncbi:LamG-like jellyroll fold domain-containing protein [Persicobacter diffluens]